MLFDIPDTPIPLNMPGASVVYYPTFFDRNKSDALFSSLKNNIKWQQDDITVFGKKYPQPRLTALYATNNLPYSYSNISMHPYSFTKDLQEIKQKIETVTTEKFTTCLLNLYRNGQDSNGWHADNEKELGPNPVIASISLGEERWFHFKHKTDKNLKQKILLNHGSLLLMQGTTQKNWLHQIPKSKKVTKPRINLTFRTIT